MSREFGIVLGTRLLKPSGPKSARNSEPTGPGYTDTIPTMGTPSRFRSPGTTRTAATTPLKIAWDGTTPPICLPRSPPCTSKRSGVEENLRRDSARPRGSRTGRHQTPPIRHQ